MPQPRELGFVLQAKFDEDHLDDTVTGILRTGFLIYINCDNVYWFSKEHTSVDSSRFDSEFLAMKQCCEYLLEICYKLQMKGIPCEGPVRISGDNQSVLAKRTIPDSTLKKESQSIAYHFIREGSAGDKWRASYGNTHDNKANLLTKLFHSGEKRNRLHHIFQTNAAAASIKWGVH